MLIWEALEERARRSPDAVALAAGSRTTTFAKLAEDVSRLADSLAARGLAEGDRLAVLLPNSIELVTTMLAANALDAIVVALSPDEAPSLTGALLASTRPKVLVASPALRARLVPDATLAAVPTLVSVGGVLPGASAYADLLASAAPRRPRPRVPRRDPIGLLVHTSGSTGSAKITAHSQARLVERADRFIETLRLEDRDGALAFGHLGRPVHFVYLFLTMLRTGGTLAIVERTDAPSAWAAYAEHRPSYALASPAFTRLLFEHPAAERADHTRLGFWVCGGESAGSALHRRVSDITGRPLLGMYGSTEAGALAISARDASTRPGSVGRPLLGVEMRLLDADGGTVADGAVGRLFVRSDTMMVGYWNDTLRTHQVLETGWYDTRDLARIDADGDLWIEGRADDAIVRDSQMVATTAVVEALGEFPGITDAVVVGIASADAGEVPVAFYRTGPSAGEPDAEALRGWVACRVAAASVPVAFHRLLEWPMTPLLKIDRRALKAEAATRARAGR